jgi:uncharacterized protein (DUF924 family)
MKCYSVKFLISMNLFLTIPLLAQTAGGNPTTGTPAGAVPAAAQAAAAARLSPNYTPGQAPVAGQMSLPVGNSNVTPSLGAPELAPRAQAILDFWFGPLANAETIPTDKALLWTGRSLELSRQIRDNFTTDLQAGARGELNQWRNTPKGRLALIILLDQFARHIFRNTAQAFALDAMARGLVLEGIQNGADRQLYPIERAFFYLPLQHAEDLNLQNASLHLYQQLVADAPETLKPQFQQFLDYAQLNQQIIARFGRFPHRNALLGRLSTPEEEQFLQGSGATETSPH